MCILCRKDYGDRFRENELSVGEILTMLDLILCSQEWTAVLPCECRICQKLPPSNRSRVASEEGLKNREQTLDQIRNFVDQKRRTMPCYVENEAERN
uniref:Uncharacterized protein n=1 Tax=Romanomermis culicivorax TaxID=13658 RepID=A0A915HFS4_ROMCU